MPPGVDLPATTFVPKPPIAVAAEKPADDGLPIFDIGGDYQIESLEQYYRAVVSPYVLVTVFDYYTPDKPLVSLRVSVSEPLPNLIPTIKQLQHIEMDEAADCFLLYRKDYTQDGPYCQPINYSYYNNIQATYQGVTEKRYLFYRVVKGISEAEASSGSLVFVQISLDCVNVETSLTVHIPVSELYPAFRQRLVDKGLLDIGPTRAFLTSTTTWAVSVATDTSYVSAYTNVYIEVIPESQRDLQPGERLLPVRKAARGSSNYLEATEKPLFLKITAATTLDELRPEIRAGLQLTEEQEKKAKYFTGDTWVQFRPHGACAGDLVLSTLPQTDSLWVVADLRRKAPARKEEAIKIHN
jgi:hypothetical protein